MSLNMKTLTQAFAKTAAVIEKTVQTTVQEVTGPKPLQDYDLLDQIGSGGPGLAWKLYSAKSRSSAPSQYPIVCVWVLDKRSLSEARARAGLSKAAEDSFFEIIRADAAKLVRLRHPGVVHVVQGLDESKNAMAMVTEPLFASVANAVGIVENIGKVPKELKGMEMGLLEVKHGMLQVAESLDFLHNNARLIHRAISPESIFITSSGAWKLGGFGFAVSADQAGDQSTVQPFHYPEYDEDTILPIQPSLDYTAPELVRSKAPTGGCASDIFSFGCLAYHLIARKPLFDCHNNVKMYINSLTYLSSEAFSSIPTDLVSDLQRMLSTNAASRPSALDFTGSRFFREDTRLRALRFLDHMLERDNMQKSEFLKALSDMWKDFDSRVLRYKTGQEQLITHVLPLLVRAYDENDVCIQEEVLRRTVSLAKQLDTKLVQQAILPRVHGLALKTTVAAVRVNALLCLAELVTTLDKHAVLDILQTIQRCTAVDRSPPTLMCTLGVANSILKQFGLEFVVDHVLPLLMPLLTAPQLNVQQFAKYMLFVKDILRKIEEKRGVSVTDSGPPQVRVTTVENGRQSQPLNTSGSLPSSTKSSPAWDEDWGPITKGSVKPLQSSGNNVSSSVQTNPVLQPNISTQSLSSISTPSSQPVPSTCPPVDIEWPPRTSSGLYPQLAENEKQKQTSEASSTSFDEIDPFADWPPRPNNSTSGLSSVPKNSTGMSTHNSGMNISSQSNTNFSTNNNPIGMSNQHQGNSMFSAMNQNSGSFFTGIPNNQNSMGSLRQGQGNSAYGMGANTSYTENKAADISSIFASSKNGQNTAPRLAPPPSSAVGRGRGRGNQGQLGGSTASRSSRSKPPSEQPPILDLL